MSARTWAIARFASVFGTMTHPTVGMMMYHSEIARPIFSSQMMWFPLEDVA